ncbi:MAG TPA: TIGR03619 family F420-dependent LLM class oxidoreductase [Acidimicrobiales bacterium]|nr:TIGR03619 family F420-dependent LLM class oxidoreductase [Acidimicrobiales bacterium]
MLELTDGQIVWGIQLPIQAQSEIFVEDWERTAGAEELATIARAAEAAGAWYVAVCDHVAIPDDKVPTMGATWYDTIATLGYLAARTTDVHLVSHVWVAAYRHPLVSANAFATLDRLSGGRIVIGVGAGHVEAEFDALGIDFHRRGALLDAAIDGIDRQLREVSVDGMHVAPRPVQTPRPPIWVGGSAPAAIRRAAERGDGWLPQGTLKRDMPAAIEQLRAHRAAAGRSGPFAIGAIAGPVHVGTPEWDTGPCLEGEAERIASYLRDYRELGVHQVQVRMVSRDVAEQADQLHAFGEQVWPLVLTS